MYAIRGPVRRPVEPVESRWSAASRPVAAVPSALATNSVRIAARSGNGPSDRRKTILVPSREKIGEKSKASSPPEINRESVVVRIDQVDVAIAAGDDQAVARQPERLGQP